MKRNFTRAFGGALGAGLIAGVLRLALAGNHRFLLVKETWENDDVETHNSDLNILRDPALSEVFRAEPEKTSRSAAGRESASEESVRRRGFC